jgi:hypothetical protein
MATQVNPQEIYLLERYSSLDYLGSLRDTWAAMVKHVEACLDSFMQNLPATYRSRPIPEQPDIVWGQRVLPNFQKTLLGLDTGYILLAHGDSEGLSCANGPLNDHKGQFDYSSEWMSPDDFGRYEALLNKAATMAGNIVATEGAHWNPLELSNYSEALGPLDPPVRWPVYRINRNVSVRTGEKTIQTGIYAPDMNDSCAEFLNKNYEEAPAASVLIGLEDLLDPTTGEKYGEQPLYEKRNCVWYLVQREADVDLAVQSNTVAAERRGSVQAGETCPETGFYFTPARPDSRRLFQKGDLMPGFDTAYGATIWQWDAEQQ